MKLEIESDSIIDIDVSAMLNGVREYSDKDVQIFLIKSNSPLFAADKPSFERSIWGRSMLEWTRLGLGGDVTILDGEEILAAVQKKLSDKPITLVAFSDTPLINTKTIRAMLEAVNTCLLPDN